MAKFCLLTVATLAICLATTIQAASPTQYVTTTSYGSEVYTVSSAFPTSDFPSMDYQPKGHEAEPRPVITMVSSGQFNDSLVNPTMLPSAAPSSEIALPSASADLASSVGSNKGQYRDQVMSNLTSIFNQTGQSECQMCIDAVKLGQQAARAVPSMVPEVLVKLCIQYNYTESADPQKDCQSEFGAAQLGGVYTQILSYANLTEASSTVNYICSGMVDSQPCNRPEPTVLDTDFLTSWFNGTVTAPANVTSRSKRTGPAQNSTLRTLHVSDFHVDPRYLVGSEAACDNGQCCRADSYNSSLWSQTNFKPGSLPKANISEPASYWGAYGCDPPWALIEAGMQGITGISNKTRSLDLGIFTGDLTTHDSDAHISQDLVKYSEQSLYDLFHRHMGNATMVVALGNHDSAPADEAALGSLPDGLSNQTSWDYENVASLVKSEGWGNDTTAKSIRSHYGGYSISPRQGLRVIAVNTDFWYKNNFFNYINADDPDSSGMLRWLTDELQLAETYNERAWIVGHVPTGWDGSNALDAPTNLFYHIVSRFSHTIAHIFFGHTHEDEFQVFYNVTNGNSTSASRKTQDAVANAFLGPSLTPSQNVQPSLRVYEVDPETYEVMDYQQYFTPISEFANLTQTGPTWHLLYSARDTYSNFSASQAANKYMGGVALDNGQWPASAPLNGTFWAAVTDEMESRPDLVQLHNLYQGRNSPRSPSCDTTECQAAKVCYMRSGSSSLGRACAKGYGSIQSGFSSDS
ncbi:hypothetical protein MYAM1_003621 [Malassezia yamatoensis]|uniref:Sphingomyelin phosphodiesterase n=1 Tax=Malassezia yamatoensis TaxID=253288 RepID=A0AAJ5YWJ1_9BASI|nr:hypothetical protein MYAM1_003621 [Malassezia yamatoensis]